MVHKSNVKYNLAICVVTVSTSRTVETDVSGLAMEQKLRIDGYEVNRTVCKDDEQMILDSLVDCKKYDVIIYVGGTGPSRRDVTYLTLSKVADKEIRGFGELFRSRSGLPLSYLSNASLFIRGTQQIYCIPGSTDATDIALEIMKGIMNHVYEELHKE
ncbi:MAG: MogA/MoaB family molybdenum cofactor biosynthesis protein [Thermoplasmatales archaeon]